MANKTITNPDHRIQDGGYLKKVLRYLRFDYIDGFVEIFDKEANQTTRQID